MAVDYIGLGDKIRFFRTKMRLSQEELAEKTDLSNVYISHLERGVRAPRLDVVINIANALNISADDLLSGSLIISGTSRGHREYEVLSDCTPEELSIILNCMANLKDQLRDYTIKKK